MELIETENVPTAFAAMVVDTAPQSIALSGGELAQQCYESLAQTPFDWSGVDVFFGDERKVPLDHPDSNGGMARRVLLNHVRPRSVHFMRDADEYDALIASSPPIDLVHLGMGPDGHTASLFPGSPALDVQDRFVVETGDDLHPHPRLTFTFPAIARARFVIVTVGEEKRATLEKVRAGEDLPATRIRAERVVWLVGPH